MRLGSIVLVGTSAVLLSCAAPRPSQPARVVCGVGADAPPRPPVAEMLAFENPGGMWMPSQIAGGHAAKLKDLGLGLDPAALSDPTSGVLGAVVSLGGCSASFVSSEGLLATNHHCATGALQHNSTAGENLLERGFLAKTRAEERSSGPQARVFVTQKVSDVTERVRAGLEKITDDRARYKAIETRQKEIVAACEKGRPEIRCSAASFYEGERYYLTEQLEIRDVRLVWAPPAGIGNYGGEIDNWRWPRHTGDVTFLRAYVGKDGRPADYSKDNVPYAPPHHLRIAKKPLAPGALVFVAGYPARTYGLRTRAEVGQAVGWGYPRRQKMYEAYLARLEETTKGDAEATIRATSFVRRFGNALTNTKGQLEGLTKGGLAETKAGAEARLRAARPEAIEALDAIEHVIDDDARHREEDAALDEIAMPRLVSAAITIVRMAEEREKPDAERDPEYQERNWPRIEQGFRALSTSYHPKVDAAVLGLAVERARTLAPKLDVGVGPSDAARLYAATKLASEETRLGLLRTAKPATLRASADPLIKLAVRLRPLQKEAEERRERTAGKMAVLKPRYVTALRTAEGREVAPDANGTLRITYGTVRGYRPDPGAAPHAPFTVLSQVIAKHRGEEPFDAPKRLLDAAASKRFGPYVDARLGEVPVDFLADLHITGGNSGSATLDANGDLVGLVFDGNYEAMASDWVFVPAITRSIHVDIRYVLWLLDAVEDGDHLLAELGVTPGIP
jgi:hypothetical protein